MDLLPQRIKLSFTRSLGKKKLLNSLILLAFILGIYLWHFGALRGPEKGFMSTGKYFDQITARVNKIKNICGPLCNDSRKGTSGKYFDQITAPINCTALFQEDEIDSPREQGSSEAPYYLPTENTDDFLMQGRYGFMRYKTHFNAMYLTSSALTNVWTYDLIEDLKQKAIKGNLVGTYDLLAAKTLIAAMEIANLNKHRVLVIGSESPWVEAAALSVGASEVVTLEYGSIHSTHPQVKTMLPWDFRQAYLNGTLGHFDAIITFSSVEHSGLGRYGDALLPWGDYIAIARGWCVTKPNGKLVIEVPWGKDVMEYNAHRIYGKIRYPHLVTNWKQLDAIGDVTGNNHRVFVLEKLENPM